MKICTITCHNVYNVGASLQAHALSQYLKDLGHEVKIINYLPEYLNHYKLKGVSNPKYAKPLLSILYELVKFPGRFLKQFEKRKNIFDDFSAKFLPTTKQVYHTNSDLKKDPPEADIYIAGSDQIWNPLFPNGKDPAFFLDFAPDSKKKVSYAASFSVENIESEDQERIRELLKDFSFISVREISGVRLIEQMKLEAYRVCDPVFLLDKSYWLGFVKESDYKPYLFVYDFDANDQIMKFAMKTANERKWEIITAFPSKYSTKKIPVMGPIEFINLIYHSQMVISNSFHATAFSIIFQKEFYVINRKENINSRMRDLLMELGLTNRMITIIDKVDEIEWNKVNNKLDDIIQQSKNFISLCTL